MLDEGTQLQLFDPKTLEDYSMQGITPSERILLRQRLAYALPKPIVDRDPGDETKDPS